MVKYFWPCNKLLCCSVWGLCKFSPYNIEAKFSHCTTSCIVLNVIWFQSNSFVDLYTFNIPNVFPWSVLHLSEYTDSSILIFMDVFMYCAKGPPSPVVESYFVIISYSLVHSQQSISNLHCFLKFHRYPSARERSNVNSCILLDYQFPHTSMFYLYENVVVVCIIF